MADQHLAPDQLVDLALGVVAEREQLVRHLSTCPRCRAEYDGISAAIDQTVAASPRVEPPPAFDRAVLDAMGMNGHTAAGRAAPTWRKPWLVAAAAAVVGVLAGAGATIVAIEAGEDEAAGRQAVLADGTALRTSDGERVGSIVRSYVDGRPVIVVGVTDGPLGAHYTCRLQLADGGERVVGEWVLESPAGATWVVPAPATGVEALELVTDAGTVWSSADI